VRDRLGFGKAGIEEYALTETSYPNTILGGTVLQDRFLNGNDSLENAFVATDKPDTLKILLLTISQPGFKTVLRVKFFNDKRYTWSPLAALVLTQSRSSTAKDLKPLPMFSSTVLPACSLTRYFFSEGCSYRRGWNIKFFKLLQQSR
jgi:hypothetical protein